MNSRKHQMLKDTGVIVDKATDLSVTTSGMLIEIVKRLENSQDYLMDNKLNAFTLNKNLMSALNLARASYSHTGKIIDLLEAVVRHKLPEIVKGRKLQK